MPRKLDVQLSVGIQVLVQQDAGQPFVQRINENYSTAQDQALAQAAKEDRYQSTIIVPPSGSVTVDLADIITAALDYIMVKTDRAITVKLGPTDVIPVNRILAKDGGLVVGTTQVVLANPDAQNAANVTLVALGH